MSDHFIIPVSRALTGWTLDMNRRGYPLGLTIGPARTMFREGRATQRYEGVITCQGADDPWFRFSMAEDGLYAHSQTPSLLVMALLWDSSPACNVKSVVIKDKTVDIEYGKHFALGAAADVTSWQSTIPSERGICFPDFMQAWCAAARAGQTMRPSGIFNGLTVTPLYS